MNKKEVDKILNNKQSGVSKEEEPVGGIHSNLSIKSGSKQPAIYNQFWMECLVNNIIQFI